jgi:uncharacterized membrane protein
MKQHPLKLISIASLVGQILNQISLLFWLEGEFRYVLALIFTLPLLLPLYGLISNKLYTYRWTGFLTMLYIIIGVSEGFSNPQLRIYAVLTLLFSTGLFVGSIYYSRYLSTQRSN